MKTLKLPRLLPTLLATLTAAVCCGTPAVAQNVIRGTAPGWPGNTAYYAPQTVYQYAPAQAAPVVRAQYAPQPTTAYYAPASAARIAYAVPAAGSYQISYAGANQPGAATTAYYGGYAPPVQRVAYMPQQQVYYAPQAVAPVTYYRVYQPAAVAPQTCGYAATTCQTSSCQQSSCGSGCGWSPWRPFAWLWRGSSSSCCKPQQTCNYGGCGQPAAAPYYVVPPAAPVIPTAPAPISSPFRTTPGTTISPPPTRSGPPGGTIINSAPADGRPALAPGSFGAPAPGAFGAPAPGAFGAPAPGSFAPPTTPGTLPDGTRDERFRPSLSDPYSQPVPNNLGTPSNNSPLMLAPPAASSSQIGGSPISGNGNYNERTNLIPQNRPSTISEPGFISPPSSVQPLNDPHGDERIQQNNNRAPQLITPGDRTAASGQRWGVIPAVWPVKANHVQPVSQVSEPLTPVVAPTQLDDGGWKSAR